MKKKQTQLTQTQQNDMKKFVDISYENKNLWLTKEGYPKFLLLSLPDYFGNKINLLNEILINFPVIREEKDVNDDFKLKEMKWILQIITSEERMKGYSCPGLPPETPEYTFKFEKQDKYTNIEPFYTKDLSKINTQSLLDTLDKVFGDLKNLYFEEEIWYQR